MNILICEDNKKDMGELRAYVRRFFKEINCHAEIIAYESGDALLGDLDVLEEKDIKIAFMDICMPGTSGIDAARKIRDKGNDMVIILTTTSLDHGLDGYSVDALQYLVKPFGYPQVESVLNKCAGLFADSIRYIEITANRLTVRLLLKNILFIEIYNHTCLFHTAAESVKGFYSLDEVWRKLDNAGEHTFLRTHRSYIVNMRHIDDAAENDFLLTNGAAVPIRRNGKLAVKQAYTDYLFALARG